MWTKAQVGVTERQTLEAHCPSKNACMGRASCPDMHMVLPHLLSLLLWRSMFSSPSNSHMVNRQKFSWHLLSVCAFLEVCCYLFTLDGRLSMPNTCCFCLHQLRKDDNSENFFHHQCQPTHSCSLWDPPQRVFAVQWWTRSEKRPKLNVTFLLSPDSLNYFLQIILVILTIFIALFNV